MRLLITRDGCGDCPAAVELTKGRINEHIELDRKGQTQGVEADALLAYYGIYGSDLVTPCLLTCDDEDVLSRAEGLDAIREAVT